MDLASKYAYFLEERCKILDDIEEFLRMILLFFISMELDLKKSRENISQNLRRIVKSLYVLHGLYGFPGSDSAKDNITGKKTRYN